MTVRQYRALLVWSVAELSRQSKVSPRTIARIEAGEPVYLHTVAAIARTFSEALSKTITIDDLEGVKIIH